jgi:hypothetical protein
VATITALILLLATAGCSGNSAGSAASGDGGAAVGGTGDQASAAQPGAGQAAPATTIPKATPIPPGGTTPPPPAMKPLPKDVARLVKLTNATMTNGTFAATYSLTETGKSGSRVSRLVEKGEKFRYEHDADPNVHEIILFDGRVAHDCQSLRGAPMKCQASTNAVFDQASFGAGHPSMLMSQIESMNVFVGRGMKASTGRRTVLGMPLQCVVFQSTFPGAPRREACVTAKGVIAYVKLDNLNLVMTRFSPNVSDREFIPPAPAK